MKNKLNVRAISAPWYMGVDFQIRDESQHQKTIVTDFITTIYKDGEYVSPHSFSLSIEKAQILMDDLWNVGLRPTEGRGGAGSLLATEKHLDDMRKIVFKKLK